MSAPRPIRLGMIGGGAGAFIGAVHRLASRLDGNYRLLAGALSSSPDRARASGAALGLSEDRIYDTYQELVAAEAARADGVEAVAIVTPNNMHFGPAKACLEAGIHVICDKPLTSTIQDAEALAATAARANALFVLTHNYTGYPMVRQAREMIRSGTLGTLRVVQAEYAQDWLTESLETGGHKQASWRTDPARSGAGGAIGDIGTHAFNLLRFVTGLGVSELAADLSSFGTGRTLDDNANIMLRFDTGARGHLWASQVAPGNENGLMLRVYGDKGGLEWTQEEPNRLWYTPFGQPKRLLTRNGAGALDAATRISRIPAGHPEGYLEGFANIYSEAAIAIRAFQAGTAIPPEVHFPTLEDGLEGMRFIEAAVKSSSANAIWVTL